MKSVVLLFGTGLIAYLIDIILVGGFLACLILKRGKAFSWKVAIPSLMVFFMLNELIYLPALINADVTFTINNPELAGFFELGPNESFTDFILEDFISITIWFVEAVVSLSLATYLSRTASSFRWRKRRANCRASQLSRWGDWNQVPDRSSGIQRSDLRQNFTVALFGIPKIP